jgi:hypothetical protein
MTGPAVIPGPGPNSTHARHHLQPHDHVFLNGGKTFKPCNGRFYCVSPCGTYFDGTPCRLARPDSRGFDAIDPWDIDAVHGGRGH